MSILTEHQLDCLRLIADGWANQQIARLMNVTEDTIAELSERIQQRLNARDRAHAVAQGFRLGLLTKTGRDYYAEVH